MNTILDTSAALIVTSDGAVQYQAKRTFAAAQNALVGLADHLQVLPPISKHSPSFCESFIENENDVLSAEIIYGGQVSDSESEQIE